VNKDFDISRALAPLSVLERDLPDIKVTKTFQLKVEGAPATGGGVALSVVRMKTLLTPPPKPTRRRTDDLGFESDNAEEGRCASDLESSDAAVDTGIESSGSSEADTTDEENVDEYTVTDSHWIDSLTKLSKPIEKRGHATGGPHKVHKPIPNIYSNTYFQFEYRTDYPGIGVQILPKWRALAPLGMGRTWNIYRSLRPHLFGEDLITHPKTMMCLRAWMIWRARCANFASAEPSRQRLFVDETARLVADLHRFQPQADGCLGHAKATTMLKSWTPDVAAAVTTLLAPPHAAAA